MEGGIPKYRVERGDSAHARQEGLAKSITYDRWNQPVCQPLGVALMLENVTFNRNLTVCSSFPRTLRRSSEVGSIVYARFER
ncbi:MAG: hypothetical protein VX520_09110 [Planctomycetota bacterium]|nr:hypothetical protein [Planctomycetota bacterium]